MKSTETQELEQYGITANETNKENSGEQIIQTEVEGTPFKWVKLHQNTGVFLALGQYRLTETMEGDKAYFVTEELKKTNWEMMIAIIGAVTQQTVNTIKGGQ